MSEAEAGLAVVTAGGRGLGRAIVEHLAGRGHRVLATYLTASAEAAELGAIYEGRVELVQADLGEAEARARLAKRAEELGGLSLLVNNLGIYPETYVEDISTDEFESVFRLTCTVGYDLVRRCSPLLDAGGRIVNIGDSGADRVEARAQATPYHIAKLGVHVLTRTFAQRLGPRGITVNMISPGFLENSVGEAGEIPLGEVTRFSDILGALDYLVSPAARHVSGTNLLVNGAWNLG